MASHLPPTPLRWPPSFIVWTGSLLLRLHYCPTINISPSLSPACFGYGGADSEGGGGGEAWSKEWDGGKGKKKNSLIMHHWTGAVEANVRNHITTHTPILMCVLIRSRLKTSAWWSGASKDSCSRFGSQRGRIYSLEELAHHFTEKLFNNRGYINCTFQQCLASHFYWFIQKKHTHTSSVSVCGLKTSKNKQKKKKVLELLCHTNFCLHHDSPKDPNWGLSLTSPPCPTFSFLLPPFPVNAQAQKDWIIALRAASG